MSSTKVVADELKKRSKFLEFHGELFLFGVKVWDFRIPPTSVQSDDYD